MYKIKRFSKDDRKDKWSDLSSIEKAGIATNLAGAGTTIGAGLVGIKKLDKNVQKAAKATGTKVRNIGLGSAVFTGKKAEEAARLAEELNKKTGRRSKNAQLAGLGLIGAGMAAQAIGRRKRKEKDKE